MSRPNIEDYDSYFKGYILQVKGESFNEILNNHNSDILVFWKTIPENKWEYSYAINKWTIKQVLQHMIDTERILAYRALSLVREDTQILNEFDVNKYAEIGNAKSRNYKELVDEWNLLRESNNLMFKSFSFDDLNKYGHVETKRISVRAILYIIFGHAVHHINIIEKRYLQDL
ncbi:DinB family protein [Flavobacteriaceae bacterium]|nr:DinB family protein [Flavobacteriaceae bacterium]